MKIFKYGFKKAFSILNFRKHEYMPFGKHEPVERGRPYIESDKWDDDYFYEPGKKFSFIERLAKVPKIIAENNNLRARLLGALRSGEDAGRIGLQLYAENEDLRAKLLLVEDKSQFDQRYVLKVTLEEKEIELKKWKQIAEDWQNRYNAVFDKTLF